MCLITFSYVYSVAKRTRAMAKLVVKNLLKILMDYLTPKVGETNNIQLPTLPQGVTFDFKPAFFQMIESNLFSGASHKDSMMHLRWFLRLCDTIRQSSVSNEYIRLVVFSFTLTKKPWEWLGALQDNRITNWAQCSNSFLHRYFSVMKTDKLQRDIDNFT